MYHVKLPRFEGPMDLLLFLVARQEYDILDLPMAEITESYWAVIDSIGVENLEDAGDFLVMAATLIAIKAKMMLPRPPQTDEEEVEDPRRELAQRLLLYQKAKEEAERLAHREENMMSRWQAGKPPVPLSAEPLPDELLVPMTLYDLTRAIEGILNRREVRRFHQVRLDRVSLDERMRWVLELIKRLERYGLLRQLQTESERMIWVVTFLAVLELTKRQQIHVEQNELFSEIFVSEALIQEPEPELEAA
jgi:segregation and condensation protein A